MTDAFICDAIRTPFGRYGGVFKDVRADDLGAVPIRELIARNKSVDWAQVADVIYGCANQAGEDNRNVARMSGLLAGFPSKCPARRLTVCAARGWMRWVPPRLQSRRAKADFSSPAASKA